MVSSAPPAVCVCLDAGAIQCHFAGRRQVIELIMDGIFLGVLLFFVRRN